MVKKIFCKKRFVKGIVMMSISVAASFVTPNGTCVASAAENVSVLDFGAVPGDATDDTAAFNSAIESFDGSTGTVTVPSGTFNINPNVGIRLKSNITLSMDASTVLEVNGTSSSEYGVIIVRNAQDVVINGGTINGERARHNGDNGEGGHGVKVIDSNYVTISNMNINSNWGDGIYLGTASDSDEIYGSNGITINSCKITDNRRSNISIVDANDVTISGCYLANAYGTAPQCGINIEPNGKDGKVPDDRVCKRIKILDTTVDVHDGIMDDYYGQYFGFSTHYYPSDKSVYTAYDLQISGCTFNGDCGNYSAKKCVISNTNIKGTFYDRYETTLNNVSCGDIWQDSNPYASDGVAPQEDPIHQWIDEEKVEAFVTRLYEVALGREPEDTGLEDWTNRLSSGQAQAVNIVQGILGSDEYSNKNKSNEDIVNDCYNAMLGRSADPEGFSNWTSNLEAGMTMEAIFAGFVGSQEFDSLCKSYGIKPGTYVVNEARDKNAGVTKFVNRLYTQALGRPYDVGGLNDWCSQINANLSRDNIMNVSTNGFFHSQEFNNKNLNNEEYVKVLYRTFLGREYDAPGLADWVGQLDSGEKDRDGVMRGFAYSPEFGEIMAQYGL
ncbi:DUF4214 domain-containing protein [Butyrivibrio proteoclasticus]|nr:DUF4214 domain-containing protein [Butyrivibrio proteoclasticus]